MSGDVLMTDNAHTCGINLSRDTHTQTHARTLTHTDTAKECEESVLFIGHSLSQLIKWSSCTQLSLSHSTLGMMPGITNTFTHHARTHHTNTYLTHTHLQTHTQVTQTLTDTHTHI